MQKFIAGHKWLIPAAGAAVQVLTGIPSAWGVFQQPVAEEYGLGGQQAGYAFSVLIAAFGVGCVLGGFLQDRKGPRCAALCGTALFAAALAGAAVLPAGSPAAFYAVFSVPAGLGTAFIYPAIQSCAQKWYAGRKGVATGLVGGAVGLSGAFLSWFVRRILHSAGRVQGIRWAFGALGMLALPVCLGGALLLQDPPRQAATAAQTGAQKAAAPQLGPGQMLRTPQYWLCTAAVCFSTPAVLLFSPTILQLGAERGLGEQTALLCISLGSLGSAAGRLLMPMLSDHTGRRHAHLLLFAISLALSAAFAFAGGRAFVAVYVGLAFCYAGISAVLPAFCTDLFGLAHAGVNYGFLALGQSVGSLAFPLLAQALGRPAARHWLAVAGAALGFAAIWQIRPQGRPQNARQGTG